MLQSLSAHSNLSMICARMNVFWYGSQSFYKKHFDTEEDRVNRLFLKAESKGVVVKKW